MNIYAAVVAGSLLALNLSLAKVAALLSLPVYMDTVGTILAASLLPFRYGVLVAALTSLLGGLVVHPAFAFYIGTQVVIAVIAVIAVRRGLFRYWWTALITGVLIAVAAALVSAPVTVMVFGGVTLSGTTAINAILLSAGKSLWESVITGSLVIESIDKTVSAFMVWVILSRLPKSVISRLKTGSSSDQ